MATYVPSATQLTEPVESQTVESAALEFRTLKTAVAVAGSKQLRVPEATIAALPELATRAGKALGFDAGGNPIAIEVAGATDPSLRTDLAASSGASLVGYLPSGTGAIATDLQTKNRERKSLLDFMTPALKAVVASGVYTAQNRLDMLTALTAAWASALAAPHDLYAPAGRYELGDSNFPWRNTQYPVTSLLDCANVTIYCDGPATVFATVSAGGADVFQLNGLMNFHVKGFPTLTASLTATLGAGSNGCSVTNGFDNLTLEISPTNCQSIDKTTYIDGGKGLSIQTPTVGQTLACGRLKATVNAKGCVHGFGLEQDIIAAAYGRGAIDIDLMAEDCFIAMEYSAGAASTDSVPQAATVGLRVKGQAINCQKAVVIGRAHGINVDIQVVNSKPAAARRLDFNGGAWTTADTIVEGLVCSYAHNSRIAVYGYLGGCDYKARIGGAAAGTSGLLGATYNSDIYLDLGGSPVIADLLNIDSGGNSIAESRLHITSYTAVTAPTEWYASANNNVIICGPAASVNFGNVKFPATQFASTDPNTLDDYQEGTFTPIFTDWSLVDRGATYSIRRGEYTKVGNTVYFICVLSLTGIGTAGAGNPAFILGLPFTNRPVPGNITGLSVGQCLNLNMTAGDIPCAFIGSGEAVITLHKWPASGTTGTVALTVGEVSADGVLALSGHYFV